MKKAFFAIIIFALCADAFAREREVKERGVFGFQFAIGSGYTFYGDGDLKDNMHDAMKDGGFARIIIYEDIGITLRLAEQLYFLGGIQMMNDYCWSGKKHSNHLSPAFFGGIQFYPGWGGLSFSLCYALGFRRDWDKRLGYDYKKIAAAKWGNGFKLGVEYDFKKGGGFVPAVGAAYTFMPTGHKDYDNTLALYIRFAFR